MTHIGLIGDHDPEVAAHRAIPLALARAADDAALRLGWTWIHTATLETGTADVLQPFHGLWCVPASPYASTSGAVAAIRFAREAGRPFLGTCGGFQHALLEYAEAVWGMAAPGHAELDPRTSDPLISPLSCSLVEQRGVVHLTPGSRLAEIHGATETDEIYHCRYGLNPRHAERLSAGPLRVCGRDAEGQVRAVELDGHPFFCATLFQPERAALTGRSHPLVAAFTAAATRPWARSSGTTPGAAARP